MGNGLEAGQAEGRETSYKATAVILKNGEGLNQGGHGGNSLERQEQMQESLRGSFLRA